MCPCDRVAPLSEPPCGSRLQWRGVSLMGGCKTGGLYEESELSEWARRSESDSSTHGSGWALLVDSRVDEGALTTKRFNQSASC